MVRKFIDSSIRYTLVFLMGLLVIVVVWQVFSRYILNAPSTFTDELARFLLIWVSFLGAAFFSGKNQHIAINVLPTRLNPINRRRLNITNNVIIILFVGCVFVIGGARLVWITSTFLQLTPTLQIPMAVIYSIGPISGLLIIYYKLTGILDFMRFSPDKVGDEKPFDREEFTGSI